MNLEQSRDRRKQLYLTRAVSFGDFTLASGKSSSYYINSKKVLFHSEAIALIGELLYDATRDLDIQALGGLEVGAIPMAAAAAMRYRQHGRKIEGFFVRKEAKGHGSKQRVEDILDETSADRRSWHAECIPHKRHSHRICFVSIRESSHFRRSISAGDESGSCSLRCAGRRRVRTAIRRRIERRFR